MITLKIDPINPNILTIRTAVDALKRGELVVFPTETVYGLAADAFNNAAVKAVFEAKGRIERQPLPVQVGSVKEIFKVVEYLSPEAERLAELFWPGQLTVILPKAAGLPTLVTGGGTTVGVRIPDHPVALALLTEFGGPIVATSANVTGQPAPATAAEAIGEVGENVAVVLDGGRSRLGVASTVVDMTVTPPKIVRQGSVDVEQVRKVLGEVEV
ncbi:MAG: L-threonylcarbamoyladenylate synthase [Armatimonadota bacterium]|jgi:L-threonylcarbamoyladenylate synthase